jgi:hypothetical protein
MEKNAIPSLLIPHPTFSLWQRPKQVFGGDETFAAASMKGSSCSGVPSMYSYVKRQRLRPLLWVHFFCWPTACKLADTALCTEGTSVVACDM